jgi:hypothetical protein
MIDPGLRGTVSDSTGFRHSPAIILRDFLLFAIRKSPRGRMRPGDEARSLPREAGNRCSLPLHVLPAIDLSRGPTDLDLINALLSKAELRDLVEFLAILKAK